MELEKIKTKLFEHLIQLREELKKEKMYLYFRMQPNGRLYVGIEYEYTVLDFRGTPQIYHDKECSCNVDVDNLTEEKYTKFIKNFDKFLTKLRDKVTSNKEIVKGFVAKFEAYL